MAVLAWRCNRRWGLGCPSLPASAGRGGVPCPQPLLHPFEAKVLADASGGIGFDVVRNQIARSIDVMLEPNPNLQEPLTRRRPDRTFFVLITPGVRRATWQPRTLPRDVASATRQEHRGEC